MKKILLERIAEIKKQNDNFSKSLMRWEKFEINGVHISNVDFKKFDNIRLLDIFERIIRKHYAQM